MFTQDTLEPVGYMPNFGDTHRRRDHIRAATKTSSTAAARLSNRLALRGVCTMAGFIFGLPASSPLTVVGGYLIDSCKLVGERIRNHLEDPAAGRGEDQFRLRDR